MLRKLFASTIAVSMLFTLGCIRSASLIKLNEDGSGELVEQVFMSPQITQMMEGSSSMMGEMAGQMGAEAVETPTLMSQFKEQAEAKVAELGEGVTLKDLREVTAPDGWKGYRATYAFADINTFTFTSDTQGSSSEGEDGSSTSMKMEGFRYGFEYADGTLKIRNLDKPEKQPEPEASQAAAAGDAGEDPCAGLLDGQEGAEVGAGADAMAAGMMQAMGGMFAGMRITVMLEVPKPIKETNASYPHDGNNRVIVLNDMKVDAVMGNPAAAQAMEAGDMARIRKLNIEGVKIEDPFLDVEVKF